MWNIRQVEQELCIIFKFISKLFPTCGFIIYWGSFEQRKFYMRATEILMQTLVKWKTHNLSMQLIIYFMEIIDSFIKSDKNIADW